MKNIWNNFMNTPTSKRNRKLSALCITMIPVITTALATAPAKVMSLETKELLTWLASIVLPLLGFIFESQHEENTPQQ
jgi:hypothetical protein